MHKVVVILLFRRIVRATQLVLETRVLIVDYAADVLSRNEPRLGARTLSSPDPRTSQYTDITLIAWYTLGAMMCGGFYIVVIREKSLRDTHQHANWSWGICGLCDPTWIFRPPWTSYS